MTDDGPIADVCMIVEGAFPYVPGGVSSWISDIIGGLPDVSFHIVAIKPTGRMEEWRVTPPANVIGVTEIALTPTKVNRAAHLPRQLAWQMFESIERLLAHGRLDDLRTLIGLLSQLRPGDCAGGILADPAMFAALRRFYERNMPTASFHQFFWAWQTLIGGCLSMLMAPLPRARLYHSISTGFAGLYAARARVATGRSVALTEHGIYQIEREIEIMMADWIENQIDSGLVIERDARDVRDIWIDAFKSYASVCYQAADPVIALYSANSAIQRRLGASPDRLRVIPNGVTSARFAALPDCRDPARPAVGFIGRVVPIKDVRTFIRAAGIVCRTHTNAMFYILGPEDEDESYAAECHALVDSLKLHDHVIFTGKVDISQWLPKLDLLVLTSLSEAQPLVILEGGAAAIPVVSSNVGCCSELLEGDGSPEQAGGIITPLVNPEATAAAISCLIADPDRRRAMGKVLQQRVSTRYDRHFVLSEYRTLYEQLGQMDGDRAAVGALS